MDANIAINWLKNNMKVLNPTKLQLMFLARNKNIERAMSFSKKMITSLNKVSH